MNKTWMGPDLLLIDGRHMLWRAAGVFDELSITTPEGATIYTGSVYGFLTILCKAHSVFGGSVVVCWDDWLSGPYYRQQMYAGYKRKRHMDRPLDPIAKQQKQQLLVRSMDEQQSILMTLLSKLGIPQIYSEGWEADDVMGTLANRMATHNVGILTGDRDLYQCVTDKHSVIRPGKSGAFQVIGIPEIEAEYSVTPTMFVELKALVGDSGDNIPGINGVGPVNAAKILKGYPTAEAACRSAQQSVESEHFSPRLGKLLAEGLETVLLSKKLVQINCAAPLTFLDCEKSPHEVTQELVRLKFKSILTGGRRERLLEMGTALEA